MTPPPVLPEDWEAILLDCEMGNVTEVLAQQRMPQPEPPVPASAPLQATHQGAPMLRLTILTLAVFASSAHAQFRGYPQPPAPTDPVTGLPKSGADARKAARDQVERSVGPESRAFTKAHGDLGISVLQQCSPATGKRLVALFQSGELGRLKNPNAALESIRRYGDPAGSYLCTNIGKLADPDALECWCKQTQTMDYVYDLRDIDRDAEELRASRKLPVPSWLSNTGIEWNTTTVVAIGVVLLVLIVLFKRRASSPAMP
jgi:hypothetical protein